MESRSTFITVLAWIFIIAAGFAFFVSIMQVVMISTMFSGDEFRLVSEGAHAAEKFMSQYFHLLVYGFCAITLFTFISSIALLKRKNWARIAFLFILSLGVLWQVGGLIMQFSVFSQFPETPAGQGFEDFELIINLFRWFSLAIGVAISGVFIWLIKRLVSASIVREFTLNTAEQV